MPSFKKNISILELGRTAIPCELCQHFHNLASDYFMLKVTIRLRHSASRLTNDNEYLHRSPLENGAIFCLLNRGRQVLDQQKGSVMKCMVIFPKSETAAILRSQHKF